MVISSIDSTCNSLVNHIRASGLNFSCQETPFSLYITIRKSFTRNRKEQLASKPLNISLDDSELQHPHDAAQKHHSIKVLVEKKHLEDTLNTTKQDLQSALKECEVREEVIEELEDQKISHCELIYNLKDKVKDLENSVDKKEVFNSENKILKGELIELKDEIKAAKKEVKTLKKEKLKIEHDFLRRSDNFEAKIKNLMDYKAEKCAEEKEAKSKEKFLLKKIKALEEDKAKATLAKNKLERDLNQNKVPKDSKSSLTDTILHSEKETQTQANIDTPYDISAPLPPIFSSNLCRITPPIKFLSRSLPNLSTILWVTPSADYLDEAEEFLSQQHDNMVKQMYRVKKEQAEIRKLEQTLNKYDLAITSTKRVAEILDDDSFYENYMDLFYPCN